MTSLPVHLATLRASLKRELARCRARPHEGGPHVMVREGELLALDDAAYAVTAETVAALAKLPDGCGAAAVWEVLCVQA